MLYMFAGAALAAIMVLVLMPGCIKKLRSLKFGQTMYELGPQSHLHKQGTPNMGGLVTAGVTVVCTVLFAIVMNGRSAMDGGAFWSSENALWALLFVCLGSMAVGFADDYIKDVKKNHEGLKPKQKIAGQLIVGVLFSLWAYKYIGSEVILPFTHRTWDLGIFYVPLMTVLVVFMTNSANLQDGLDGLLGTVTVTGMAGYGVIALLFALSAGTAGMNNYFVAGILAFALAGAKAGYLRYNHYPAQIFMGDTGSMFVGGAMVGIAVVLRIEFLLLLISFTCVMSSVSVIMQRVYFKLTHGKRIFKMSPIHHHFELCGMKETQIVLMYGAVTILLSVIAVLSVMHWF